METQRVLVPDFYEKFTCLGGDCPDNCCKEWGQIAIDKETYKKYKNSTSSEFAKKARTAFEPVTQADGKIDPQKAAVIVLNEHKLCPFLNPNKLCEIQQKMGAHYLCNVCRLYPRMKAKSLNGNLEFALFLSCIEAMGLALLHNGKQKFIKINVDKKSELLKSVQTFNSKRSILHSFAGDIRQSCIEIMQNEEFSIRQRIFNIADFLHSLDQAYFNDKNADEIKQLIKEKAGTAKEINISAEQVMLVVKAKSLRFGEFVEMIRKITGNAFGQEAADKMNGSDIYKHIAEKSEEKWQELLKSNALIFENYFVNFIFQSVFPFSYYDNLKLNMFLHAFLLMERLELLRLFLGAYAINGEIEPGQIVKVACQIEKTFSDGIASAYRVLQVYSIKKPASTRR